MENHERNLTNNTGRPRQPHFVEVTDLADDTDLMQLRLHQGNLVLPATPEAQEVIKPAEEAKVSSTAGAADSGSNVPVYSAVTPKWPNVKLPSKSRQVSKRGGGGFLGLGQWQQAAIGLVALVVLVALIVWALLAFVIAPAPRMVQLDLALRDQVNYSATLPTAGFARTIETDIAVESEQTATGSIMVPDAPATGKISLYNPNGSAVTLSAGTVIASVQGVEYKLAQAVTIPPLSVSVNVPNQTSSTSGGFATGTVVASPAGTKGNLPGGFGRVTTSRGVQAASQGGITGGTDRPAVAATQQDIDQLRQRLTDAAQAKAQDIVKGQIPQGWQVFATPGIETKDLKITLVQQPDQEAAQGKFGGKATAHVTATIYNPQEALAAAVAQEPAPAYEPATNPQPVLKQVSKTEQGVSVQYTRSVVPEKLTKFLTTWQGNQAQLEQLMADLIIRPEVQQAKLLQPLDQGYKGNYRVEVKEGK